MNRTTLDNEDMQSISHPGSNPPKENLIAFVRHADSKITPAYWLTLLLGAFQNHLDNGISPEEQIQRHTERLHELRNGERVAFPSEVQVRRDARKVLLSRIFPMNEDDRRVSPDATPSPLAELPSRLRAARRKGQTADGSEHSRRDSAVIRP